MQVTSLEEKQPTGGCRGASIAPFGEDEERTFSLYLLFANG
jgi:hypothetical protein